MEVLAIQRPIMTPIDSDALIKVCKCHAILKYEFIDIYTNAAGQNVIKCPSCGEELIIYGGK